MCNKKNEYISIKLTKISIKYYVLNMLKKNSNSLKAIICCLMKYEKKNKKFIANYKP